MPHTTANNPTTALPFPFPLYNKNGGNSKQEYKRSLKNEIKHHKKEYDNIKAIVHTATKAAYHAQVERVSRRLLLAKQWEKMPVACAQTGIVSLLDIPSVPDNFIEWDSPFQSLVVCRSIASRGVSYLRKLDTQVLAGVLITLTKDYELLHTGTPFHGVEVNAILRTAGKDNLIKAILLIEDYVHSKNLIYIPKLSLAWDTGISNGVEARLINWLKLIVEYVVRPAPIEDTYKEYKKNEFKAPKKLMRPVTIVQAKATALANFRADMKVAKICLALIPASSISSKMRTIIINIISGKVADYTSMDSNVLSLIADKLELLEDENANRLSAIFRKDRSAITANEINEFDAPISASSAFVKKLEVTLEADTEESDDDNNAEQEIAISAKEIKEEKKPVAKKSFIELLIEKKKQAALIEKKEYQEKKEEIKLLIPAPVYVSVRETKVFSAHFESVRERMLADSALAAAAFHPERFNPMDFDSIPSEFCTIEFFDSKEI